jgi:predicted nucleic acid-binding protein
MTRTKRRAGVEEAPSARYAMLPPARFTIDTNVLIYGVDAKFPEKQVLVKSLLFRASTADCLLTLQSVREFFNAISRKRLLSRSEAAIKAASLFDTFRMCTETRNATIVALQAASIGKASVWDALLVATAVEASCSYVISEDMAPGMHPLGARIVRPFDGDRLSDEVEALLV